MERLGGEDVGQRTSMRTVASASLVGAIMEALQRRLFRLPGGRSTGWVRAVYRHRPPRRRRGSPWLVSAFPLALAILALVCVYLLTETFQGDVAEGEEHSSRQHAEA